MRKKWHNDWCYPVQLIACTVDQGCQLATLGAFQCSPRDDSKLPNEFRQYCNGLSSNKRLNPWSQATLVRYRFFSFGDNFTWCNNKTRFVVLMRAMMRRCWKGDDLFFEIDLHYRDRCPQKWWSPNRKLHAALGTIAHICNVPPRSPRVWHPCCRITQTLAEKT